MRLKCTTYIAGLMLFGAAAVAGDFASDVAVADILPGWRTEDGRHISALRIQLAPGWKTYWRAPGEVGIPPSFDWTASRNLKNLRISWPVPSVFDQNGMRSIGYDNDVVIPIELTAHNDADDIQLQGAIDIGVCQDICVPVRLDVGAILTTGKAGPTPMLSAALRDRPLERAQAGVRGVKCEISPISDGMRLTAHIDMPPMGDGEVAVVEVTDPSIWVAESTVTRDGNTLIANTELVPPSAEPFMLARSDIRVTVFSGGHAVDIRGCN